MANPTSNFNWQMPTPTDLVTDLPADFEVFGQAVDTSLADLLGGTSGQILAKNSNTDMDFVWITNDVGDITAVTAGTGLTGGGTSGAVTLSLDTTAVQGPAFRAFRSGTNQTFTAATWTKVQLISESYDTANCFDPTTNYRFTPNKAGYYQFNASIWMDRGASGNIYAAFYLNGNEVSMWNNMNGVAFSTVAVPGSDLIYLNGTTDYIELYIYDSNATSRTVNASGGSASFMSGTWIRS
jgi:hypothetical protein